MKLELFAATLLTNWGTTLYPQITSPTDIMSEMYSGILSGIRIYLTYIMSVISHFIWQIYPDVHPKFHLACWYSILHISWHFSRILSVILFSIVFGSGGAQLAIMLGFALGELTSGVDLARKLVRTRCEAGNIKSVETLTWQDGAPQWCLWVYKPHEYHSEMGLICTTERSRTGAPPCGRWGKQTPSPWQPRQRSGLRHSATWWMQKLLGITLW